MPEIAIVTTCKGRLQHLRETLPMMVAQGASEVIVVDYGCPDGAGEWVAAEFPHIKVVRVDDDPGFCLSRARNQGAAHADADWLAFIDADIKVAPGWIDWLRQNVEPGKFYQVGPINGMVEGQLGGTIACARADFEAIGGYDEVMKGWGSEDVDLVNRLLYQGLARARYPGELVEAIPHGNDQRAGWAGMANIQHKILLDQCYLALKMHVMMTRGESVLSAELRENLLDETRTAVGRWFAQGANRPLDIRYTSPGMKPVHLPGNNVMSSDLTFTIHVKHERPEPAMSGADQESGGSTPG